MTMPLTRQKLSHDAKPDRSERRIRGRDAQRRYRSRKEHALKYALHKNERLEAIIEKTLDVFLGFVGQSMTYESLRSSPTWQLASKEAIQNIQNLAAELNNDINVNSNHDVQPTNPDVSPNSKSEIDRTPQKIYVPQYRYDAPEMMLASTKLKLHQHAQTIPSLTDGKSGTVPSSVLFMPTNMPIMSEDHWFADYLEGLRVPFCMRILYHGLLTSYNALRDGANAISDLGAWFARSHRFSLLYANTSILLALTKQALSKLVIELQHDVSPVSSISGKQSLFSSQRYEKLGLAVQRDMELSGLLKSDLLDANDVEIYLRAKGQLSVEDDELQLRMKFPGKKNSSALSRVVDEKIVKIDMKRFIDRLVEGALCLGDGIGFPKTVVNNAIVSAATSLSDVNS